MSISRICRYRLKKTVLLMSFLLPGVLPVSSRGEGLKADLTVSSGYRVDNFQWNIAGDVNGQNPNILSELTWKNLLSYQVKGNLTVTYGTFFYARGSADSAWIGDGTIQDSDYLGDNRTREFSRSISDSRGNLVDSSLGAGYPLRHRVNGSELMWVPLVGYAYNLQRFRITNGNQVIPPTGSFQGLDSTYRTQWWGPWLGSDFSWTTSSEWTFLGGFEYHWVNYRAVDNHNLRTDLQHPESFVHTAAGSGFTISGGADWVFSKRLSLRFNGDYTSFSTRPGVDTAFFSDGSTSTTQLHEVTWSSWVLSLGLNIRV